MPLYRRARAVPAAVLAALLLYTPAASAAGWPPTTPPTTPVRLSGPTPFDGCVASDPSQLRPNTETEVMSAVNPVDPRNVVTIWQQDRFLTGSSRGIVVAVSRDAGRTWTRAGIPGMTCLTLSGRITNPWLSFGRDGRLYATATTTGATSTILASTSDDGGTTWRPPTALVADGTDRFNDKQTTAHDPRDPRRAYAVWNRRTNGANRHEILFARTTDGGATWEAARPIYAPPSPAGTVGNQIAVLRDGSLLNVFFQNDLPIGSPPAPTLTDHVRAMRSTDHGTTWSAPVTIADLRMNVPTAPDTGGIILAPGIVPDVAVDPRTDAVYVVWGDATRSTSRSAAVLAVSRTGGRTWTVPVRVDGSPESAAGGPGQAFLPQVDVADNGTVAVSYYDLRNDTAEPGTSTDHWISTCRGPACAVTRSAWRERHVGGPFAIDRAVTSFGGPFVGTYTGLTHWAHCFVATFVMTTDDPMNQQDVFQSILPTAP